MRELLPPQTWVGGMEKDDGDKREACTVFLSKKGRHLALK